MYWYVITDFINVFAFLTLNSGFMALSADEALQEVGQEATSVIRRIPCDFRDRPTTKEEERHQYYQAIKREDIPRLRLEPRPRRAMDLLAAASDSEEEGDHLKDEDGNDQANTEVA